MSLKSDLLKKLTQIVENPENEFDRIIAESKDTLDTMTEQQLCDIYTLRNNSVPLCKRIPYSRNDIASLLETNEVSPYNSVAKLENNFTVAECIFTQARGEDF